MKLFWLLFALLIVLILVAPVPAQNCPGGVCPMPAGYSRMPAGAGPVTLHLLPQAAEPSRACPCGCGIAGCGCTGGSCGQSGAYFPLYASLGQSRPVVYAVLHPLKWVRGR